LPREFRARDRPAVADKLEDGALVELAQQRRADLGSQRGLWRLRGRSNRLSLLVLLVLLVLAPRAVLVNRAHGVDHPRVIAEVQRRGGREIAHDSRISVDAVFEQRLNIRRRRAVQR
jgi:hypothetical protein